MSAELQLVSSRSLETALPSLGQSPLPFGELPPEMQLMILQIITKSKDVANLNLVSRYIRELNQDSCIASSRVIALFSKFSKKWPVDKVNFLLVPSQTYSYENYTKEVSREHIRSQTFKWLQKYSERRWGAYTEESLFECYNALPNEGKNALKGQIWIANNRNDEGRGFGYGDWIITNRIKTAVVLQAVLDLSRKIKSGQEGLEH
jgi:hypothetical protein